MFTFDENWRINFQILVFVFDQLSYLCNMIYTQTKADI